MKQVGKNIKKHRTEKGMTQDQLAEKLNVTRQAVSNWETGKTEPNIETLTSIAARLDISVEALIYGKTSRSLDSSIGSGTIFGGLFFLLMLAWILFAEILLDNIWWLMITASLILAGLITALFRQDEKLDILTVRIEQLERKE